MKLIDIYEEHLEELKSLARRGVGKDAWTQK